MNVGGIGAAQSAPGGQIKAAVATLPVPAADAPAYVNSEYTPTTARAQATAAEGSRWALRVRGRRSKVEAARTVWSCGMEISWLLGRVGMDNGQVTNFRPPLPGWNINGNAGRSSHTMQLVAAARLLQWSSPVIAQLKEEMNECVDCGSPVDDTAQYCAECGTPLEPSPGTQ